MEKEEDMGIAFSLRQEEKSIIKRPAIIILLYFIINDFKLFHL